MPSCDCKSPKLCKLKQKNNLISKIYNITQTPLRKIRLSPNFQSFHVYGENLWFDQNLQQPLVTPPLFGFSLGLSLCRSSSHSHTLYTCTVRCGAYHFKTYQQHFVLFKKNCTFKIFVGLEFNILFYYFSKFLIFYCKLQGKKRVSVLIVHCTVTVQLFVFVLQPRTPPPCLYLNPHKTWTKPTLSTATLVLVSPGL